MVDKELLCNNNNHQYGLKWLILLLREGAARTEKPAVRQGES